MSLSFLDGILFLNQRMLWGYMQKPADVGPYEKRQVLEEARFQVPLEVAALWFACLMNRSYGRPEVPSPQETASKDLSVLLSCHQNPDLE